jgi:hypothetical protein
MTARRVTFTLHGHGDSSLYPPLPLVVVDAARREVCRLSLSTSQPAAAAFESAEPELLAVLQLPNGRAVVKPLEIDGAWQDTVSFEVGTESPHEWMAWSAMRVDLRRSIAPLMAGPDMEGAWLQLWELADSWRQVEVPVDRMIRGDDGFQLDLDAWDKPRALVADLGAGSPQVVALPAMLRLMVLVTRAHALQTSAAPRILVGGYGGAAEGVLEFMRKGSLGLAGNALDPGSQLANELLYGKIADRFGATAAAYYLLRKRDWPRLPQHWLENLAGWFPLLPDATLLRDASLIQRGIDAQAAPALAARSIKAAFARGLPLFAEARFVMADLFSYAELATGADALTPGQTELIRRMLSAFQPAGLTFGFHGTTPMDPMPAHEAQGAARALAFQRRLGALGDEARHIGALAGLAATFDASGVSRGLELVARGVDTAFAALGPTPAAVPGDATRTFFFRDGYAPAGRALQALAKR